MTDFIERAKACFEAGGECETAGGKRAKILAIHDGYLIAELLLDGEWRPRVFYEPTFDIRFGGLVFPKQVLAERWMYVYKSGHVATLGAPTHSDEPVVYDHISAYKHTYYEDGTCETERLK